MLMQRNSLIKKAFIMKRILIEIKRKALATNDENVYFYTV